MAISLGSVSKGLESLGKVYKIPAFETEPSIMKCTSFAAECGLSNSQVMSQTEPIASVVITTKNRRDELRAAIASALAQSVCLEVIVVDDGSTDGTQEMVRSLFPGVVFYRSEHSRGYIAQRNYAATIARTSYIFSLDDDAEFSTPHIVEQTLPELQECRVGAVAIPYIEPLKSGDVMQRAPTNNQVWMTDSFVGTAHAVRRDVFLQLNGYREILVHQGEERDLCIRMLSEGWITRLGSSDPIVHHESPRRNLNRMDYYGRRNDILFAFHNVPWPWLPLHLAATSVNGVRAAFRLGRFSSMMAGICAGYWQGLRSWSDRKPVSVETYRLGRTLKRPGSIVAEGQRDPGKTIPVPSCCDSDKCLLTIIITTRNRISELDKTLAACADQDWPRLEIQVIDDASTDGTFEHVRAKFPHVTITRRETHGGSISARNELLRRAQGKYIIGLDDDSRFVDFDACRRVVQRMEAEPDLGIISFQAIGPENPERMTDAGRLHGEWHCSSFAACGMAIRRSMLEKTGLLPEFFFHAYEEPDLCLRAWNAGFRVLQWNDIVVYHEFSGLNRNEQRTHRRHARNEACSVWMRSPWHLVLPMTLARLAGQARYAASRGWLLREPRVWAEFLWRLPRCLFNRQAVSTQAVKICIALNRMKVADPRLVWKLGELSWREILRGQSALELHKEAAAIT